MSQNKCPPCHGNCGQSRQCPADRDVPRLLTVVAIMAAPLVFVALVWVVGYLWAM
jgi:hypothetical protein